MRPVTLSVLLRKLHWMWREMKPIMFPGTEYHPSYWSEKVWGGEGFLCSSIFSTSVWSISSPVWWTNDFSTQILWGNSRFWKLLQNSWSSSNGSQFSLSSVSLPPTLPHQSVGNCSQLSHLLPLEICMQCSWSGAESIGLYLLPASPSNSFYPFKRFPTIATLWKDHGSLWSISKKLLSCRTSSPAVSLSERRVCQPAVCSGMTYTTKARPNEVLGSSQSYIESSIMFRKYFINVCGGGDVSICPPNWSWDVMTLYITKDN